MRTLTKINERKSVTLMEVINGREIYYNYDLELSQETPQFVTFATQGGQNSISGQYSANAGFSLNGQGVTNMADFQLANVAFQTMLDITAGNFTANIAIENTEEK